MSIIPRGYVRLIDVFDRLGERRHGRAWAEWGARVGSKSTTAHLEAKYVTPPERFRQLLRQSSVGDKVRRAEYQELILAIEQFHRVPRNTKDDEGKPTPADLFATLHDQRNKLAKSDREQRQASYAAYLRRSDTLEYLRSALYEHDLELSQLDPLTGSLVPVVRERWARQDAVAALISAIDGGALRAKLSGVKRLLSEPSYFVEDDQLNAWLREVPRYTCDTDPRVRITDLIHQKADLELISGDSAARKSEIRRLLVLLSDEFPGGSPIPKTDLWNLVNSVVAPSRVTDEEWRQAWSQGPPDAWSKPGPRPTKMTKR